MHADTHPATLPQQEIDKHHLHTFEQKHAQRGGRPKRGRTRCVLDVGAGGDGDEGLRGGDADRVRGLHRGRVLAGKVGAGEDGLALGVNVGVLLA